MEEKKRKQKKANEHFLPSGDYFRLERRHTSLGIIRASALRAPFLQWCLMLFWRKKNKFRSDRFNWHSYEGLASGTLYLIIDLGFIKCFLFFSNGIRRVHGPTIKTANQHMLQAGHLIVHLPDLLQWLSPFLHIWIWLLILDDVELLQSVANIKGRIFKKRFLER